MPKTQTYVEVKVDGEWVHAFVVGGDAGNLVVEYRTPLTSNWERKTVKEGTGEGQFRG